MNDPDFSLAGKRIVVTGGTRGIGRAISSRFVRSGAHVVAVYVRDEDAAQSLATACSDSRDRLETCRADLSTDAGRHHLISLLDDAAISGFVHCAATGVHRPVTELSLRHWDFTFALNLRAFFDLVTALLPRFVAGASIVGVSSQGAVQAVPHYSLVGATKGGLEALCRHLAVELAPRNVRVNVLSPGSVLTDAWNAFPDRDLRLQRTREASPNGRLTTVEEVAAAAHFLCCDASSGVNGHTLVVDGGQRICG